MHYLCLKKDFYMFILRYDFVFLLVVVKFKCKIDILIIIVIFGLIYVLYINNYF